MEGVVHSLIRSNGVELHLARAGPADGPLVLLLHGFPEFWYGWRHQLLPLARGGLLTVAPDGRGYNRSGKPAGSRPYRLDELARDVLGVMDALERRKAFVVGHDWGGIVAWWLAAQHPERVEKAVIINAPHPLAMYTLLRRSAAQVLRSSYALAFQVPLVPELTLSAGRFAALKLALRCSSRAGTFTDRDLRAYEEAWRRPAALGSMLNWYRAALRHPRSLPHHLVRVPVRILWGTNDAFLTAELARMSLALCADGQLTFFPEAGHFLQLEEPGQVTGHLLDYFGVGANRQ